MNKLLGKALEESEKLSDSLISFMTKVYNGRISWKFSNFVSLGNFLNEFCWMNKQNLLEFVKTC